MGATVSTRTAPANTTSASAAAAAATAGWRIGALARATAAAMITTSATITPNGSHPNAGTCRAGLITQRDRDQNRRGKPPRQRAVRQRPGQFRERDRERQAHPAHSVEEK